MIAGTLDKHLASNSHESAQLHPLRDRTRSLLLREVADEGAYWLQG